MIRILLAAVTFVLQVAEPLPRQSGSVSGVLRTSQGAPLAGIPVAVIPADGTVASNSHNGPETATETNSFGVYVISNIPAGRYRLLTGRPGSITFHPGVHDIRLATTIDVVAGDSTNVSDMVFPRVKVSGRIVDELTGSARPIGSLSLCCQYSSDPGLSALGSISLDYTPVAASIRDDGTFQFLSIPPGNYYFQVFDSGIASYALPVSIAGNDMTGIELKVSSGTPFNGSLVDKKGRPIPYVSVTLKPQPGNAAFGMPSTGPDLGGTMVLESANRDYSSVLEPSMIDIRNRLIAMIVPQVAPSGPDGQFTFGGVLPGKYTIEVRSPKGGFTKREVDVGFTLPGVQVELPIAQLAGRVVMEGGGPLAPIRGSVRIFSTAEGSQVLYISPDVSGRFFLLMEPGEYRVRAEDLVPDHRILSITDGSRDLLNQSFVFTEANAPEITITVSR